VTERNGHRDRVLTTKAGDLDLAIPKLRKGSFFPSVLEPRHRIDQALYAVVMEACVSGVSTRSVDTLDEIAAETGFHPSTISQQLKADGPPVSRRVPDSALVINAFWEQRITRPHHHAASR
jgi:transposase-like protein